MSVADLLTAVLLPLGGLFTVLGGLGLVRLPDVLSRLQAIAKPQTLGILLILGGAAPQLSGRAAAALLLVALFQLVTTPIVALSLARVAVDTGELRRESLVVNELPSDPEL